jgi:hypothetical protein
MDKVTGIIVVQTKKEISTNSMEQNTTSEAENHSGLQAIPHLLRNTEVHYHIHNSLPLDPLDQLNPLHALKPYFFQFHSN